MFDCSSRCLVMVIDQCTHRSAIIVTHNAPIDEYTVFRFTIKQKRKVQAHTIRAREGKKAHTLMYEERRENGRKRT